MIKALIEKTLILFRLSPRKQATPTKRRGGPRGPTGPRSPVMKRLVQLKKDDSLVVPPGIKTNPQEMARRAEHHNPKCRYKGCTDRNGNRIITRIS